MCAVCRIKIRLNGVTFHVSWIPLESKLLSVTPKSCTKVVPSIGTWRREEENGLGPLSDKSLQMINYISK